MLQRKYFRNKRGTTYVEFNEKGWPIRQIQINRKERFVLLLTKPEDMMHSTILEVQCFPDALEITREDFERVWAELSQQPHGTSWMDDPSYRRAILKIEPYTRESQQTYDRLVKEDKERASLYKRTRCIIPNRNWSLVSSPDSPPGRTGHAMAAAGDGRIYLFSGGTGQIPPPDDTWVLDPATAKWKRLFPQTSPPPRWGSVMARGGDGNLYLFGRAPRSIFTDTWMLCINAGKWVQLQPPVSPLVVDHAMATGGDGRIYLFGGRPLRGAINSILADTWVFDPASATWIQLELREYPPARFSHAMTTGADGNIYLYGGQGADCEDLGDMWVFDPAKQQWKEITPPKPSPPNRSGHAMATGGDGRIYLLGGSISSHLLDDLWSFDPKRSNWIEINPPNRLMKGSGYVMATGGDGRIYLFGGGYENLGLLDDTWVFDPFIRQ